MNAQPVGMTAQESPEELTVGQRIRQARGRLTQVQVARRIIKVADGFEGTATLGALVTMISKWEHDKIVPDPYNRQLLAKALGVSLADLGLDVDPYLLLEAEGKAR